MKTTMMVTKIILARIWWLGRGMATITGIAMMLALTVGLASTALAGTGIGTSLDLGKVNVVDDVTTQLVGKVAGPTFTIVNNHDGKVGNNEQRAASPPPGEPPPPIPDPTITVPAPALGLQVSPGQTPITVNPEAGTARDLSADELDGKDSSQFLANTGKAKDADRLDGLDSSSYLKTSGKAADADRLDGKDSTSFANGTNGKANDANLLDGKDSSAFVSSTLGTAPNANNLDGQDSTRFFSGKAYSVENSSLGPGGGGITSRIALCDEGDNVLGGGGGSFADEPILDSFPLGSRAWSVTMRDESGPSEIRATALCADFPPLR